MPQVTTKPALAWYEARPAITPVNTSDNLYLCHPLSASYLLALPCVDTGNTVHFGTVKEAFFILSGNQRGIVHRYDPTSKTIGEEVDLAWDEGVAAGDVTWIVGTGSSPKIVDWGIVPNFTSWIGLKASETPQEWQDAFVRTTESHWPGTAQSAITTFAKGRDQLCLVSAGKDALEGAHVLPQSQRAWLSKGNGQFLKRDIATPDVPHNVITLNVAIHRIFDAGIFVLAPKNGKPAIHFLGTAHETYHLFSNRNLHLLNDPCASAQYARFAWALFEGAKENLKALEDSVLVRVGEDCRWVERRLKGRSGEAPPEERDVAEEEEEETEETAEGSKKRKRVETRSSVKAKKADTRRDDCAAGTVEGSFYNTSKTSSFPHPSTADKLDGPPSTPSFDSSRYSSPPSEIHFSDLDSKTKHQLAMIADEVEYSKLKRLALATERERYRVGGHRKEEKEEDESDWPILTPQMRIWVHQARVVRAKRNALGQSLIGSREWDEEDLDTLGEVK